MSFCQQTSKNNTIVLLLAAGSSQRFANVDKRLCRIAGLTLIEHAIKPIKQAALDFRLVIRSSETDQFVQLLPDSCDKLLSIDDHIAEQGMGSSLAAAINRLSAESAPSYLIISLADMPLLKSSTYRKLDTKIRRSGYTAIVPCYREKSWSNAGNPVAIQAPFIELFSKLTGDKGGKAILKAHAEQTSFLVVEDPGIYIDVDQPETLAAVSSELS